MILEFSPVKYAWTPKQSSPTPLADNPPDLHTESFRGIPQLQAVQYPSLEGPWTQRHSLNLPQTPKGKPTGDNFVEWTSFKPIVEATQLILAELHNTQVNFNQTRHIQAQAQQQVSVAFEQLSTKYDSFVEHIGAYAQ